MDGTGIIMVRGGGGGCICPTNIRTGTSWIIDKSALSRSHIPEN